MSITIKQLAALAEEYKFDFEEARRFLGHAEPKKRGRPSKKSSDSESSDEEKAPPKSKAKAKEEPKPPTEKKAKPPPEKKKTTPKTGYQLFLSENAGPIGEKLRRARKSLGWSEKLHRGEVSAEAGRQWKALTDAKREEWNTTAKQTKPVV